MFVLRHHISETCLLALVCRHIFPILPLWLRWRMLFGGRGVIPLALRLEMFGGGIESIPFELGRNTLLVDEHALAEISNRRFIGLPDSAPNRVRHAISLG